MSTRAELKNRAKQSLRGYYWWAVLACFLAGLLGGGSGHSFQLNLGSTQGVNIGQTIQQAVGGESELQTFLFVLTLIGIMLVVFLITFVIGLLWGTFVGNPIRVGSCVFFMESRDQMQSVGIGKLFWAFEGGRYKNIIMVMFMRWLYTFLWSLLFIIPGVIKAYEYYLVPYILHDNPNLHYKDALQISKDMMNGNKMRLFVLELSFIGWEILAALCCGMGFLFLAPYMEATYAEFYEDVRGQYFGMSRTCAGYEESVVCDENQGY